MTESARRWGQRHKELLDPGDLDWRESLGLKITQAHAWQLCHHGDWMLSQWKTLPFDARDNTRLAINRANKRIVNRAVQQAMKSLRGTQSREATRWRYWARRWLDGKRVLYHPGYWPHRNKEPCPIAIKAARAAAGAARCHLSFLVSPGASHYWILLPEMAAEAAAWAARSSIWNNTQNATIARVWDNAAKAEEIELFQQAEDYRKALPEWPENGE